MTPHLVNLSDNAIAPAPQGILGLGSKKADYGLIELNLSI
jgi:hypothetical protein